jgi:hypothetical protein
MTKNKITIALFIAAFCSLLSQLSVYAFDHEHKLFTAELHKYVDKDLVHYSRWKHYQDGLKFYIATLSALTGEEYKSFSESEKKAFWVNAYNALTIKLVLDNYPINGKTSWYPKDSIRQIDGFWEKNHFKIAERDVTLETIMHKLIRSRHGDPRMHFVVVPASKGCLPLRNAAYTADAMESDLKIAADKFLNDPKQVRFDPKNKQVFLSQIFEWFPLDFAKAAGFIKMPMPPPSDEEIVLTYILGIAPPAVREQFSIKDTKVSFIAYDWSLNDADKPVSTQPNRSKNKNQKSKKGK